MKVVIIPAYQPDYHLTELVESLTSNGFSVLVVDDGSKEKYQSVFEGISQKAKIIHSPCNEGKGSALKRGISALKEFYPECDCFITADADGQHKVEDIVRVANELENGAEMVLTVRKLNGKIPFRSKIGNDLSRVVYTVMNGHYFDDNQSGLRGFAIRHADWLLKVKGCKYDYEMNTLIFADKQAVRITLLPINAIYIDDNKSSHFNPLKDTLRIYKRMFFSVWPSLIGILLWIVATVTLSFFFRYNYFYVTVPSAVMISSCVNVLLQKIMVFRKFKYKDGLRTLLFSLIRATVYTVFAGIMGATFSVVPLFVSVFVMSVIMLTVEYFLHKTMHGFYRKNVK